MDEKRCRDLGRDCRSCAVRFAATLQPGKHTVLAEDFALPPRGKALRDSHAEVIARRGALLWLLEEVQQRTTMGPPTGRGMHVIPPLGVGRVGVLSGPRTWRRTLELVYTLRDVSGRIDRAMCAFHTRICRPDPDHVLPLFFGRRRHVHEPSRGSATSQSDHVHGPFFRFPKPE
ncbi:hypothetical protein BJY52DRAFT_1359770 [Lactarius psammicola]|nr:hypothetical protein BJY52DRAFT_1359770 [Lactarius psammicola]